MYSFSMQLESAFQVLNSDLEQQFDNFCREHHSKGKSSNRKQLFHGTPRGNAMSIIASGFKLPNRPGMFGKGVYFAGTPLKSFQYTARHGTMLLCDVELGNSMTARSAKTDLEPERDLQ